MMDPKLIIDRTQSAQRAIENAYTDGPGLHTNLILGSLQLLFWLFFHPSAWRNYIARIAPNLPPNFCLIELNYEHWHNAALRRLFIMSYLVLPFMITFTLISLLWGLRIASNDALTGILFVISASLVGALTIGLLVSAAASIIMGLASCIFLSLVISFAAGMDNQTLYITIYITTVVIAISFGSKVMAHVVGNRSDYPPARRIGSIVIGVICSGVSGALAVAVINNGAEDKWLILASNGVIGHETQAIGVATTSVFGIVIGSIYGIVGKWFSKNWIKGSLIGVITSLIFIFGNILGNIKAPGLLDAAKFGTAGGVWVCIFFVLSYVLTQRLTDTWSSAIAGTIGFGIALYAVLINMIDTGQAWLIVLIGFMVNLLSLLLVWESSFVIYPLLAAWNYLLYRADERRIYTSNYLLRWHSAFWDEYQRLPLLGLEDHLILITERDPVEGQVALDYLSISRQRWAVQAAQIELDARCLESCTDIQAIINAHRQLAVGELTGPANAIFQTFSRYSQDVEAALNQATPYHQRLALTTVEGNLSKLGRELTLSSERYAIRFYPIANKWHQIVSEYVKELVETVELSQALDNPYIFGVPLTEQQDIFIGRTDIVARIEQLLLDRRRPPLLLYGQRRMGKTSLLRNLGRLLPQHIVPMFIDGQAMGLANDYSEFLYYVAKHMRKSASDSRGLILPDFMHESLKPSPFTRFIEWLDEIKLRLPNQKQAMVLLMLDEFEVLDTVIDKGRFDERDVFNLLRHIIQHYPHFKILLAGSHPLSEFKRWSSYLINVQVIKIFYLERNEACQLIEQPIKGFALRYEPDAMGRILGLTRCHPALIQLLCYEIVTLKNKQSPAKRRLASLEDVEAAIPNALKHGSFFFLDVEQNQIPKLSTTLLRIMAEQGEGVSVSRGLLSLQVNTATELNQFLDLLIQCDLIEELDGGYRFQIELIRRWFAQDQKV